MKVDILSCRQGKFKISIIDLFTAILLATSLSPVSCQSDTPAPEAVKDANSLPTNTSLESGLRIFTNDLTTIIQALTGQNLKNFLKTSIPDLKIGLLQLLSALRLNPFTIFNAFIQALRTTLPTIAPIGQFTLLQTALVLTIGGLAAGAAVIAAEAFYFKQLHDDEIATTGYLRRQYDLHYGPYNQQKGSNRRKVNLELPFSNDIQPPAYKKYKPQSLRRTQRRNQRKNKNAGEQYDNWKRLQDSKVKANRKKQRKRRQIQYTNIVYPTVAPRPYSFLSSKPPQIPNKWFQAPPSFSPPRRVIQVVKQPEREDSNMFSLTAISDFIRSRLPSWVPWFGNIKKSTNLKYLSERRDESDTSSGFTQVPLKRNRNMITRSFQRYYNKNR